MDISDTTPAFNLKVVVQETGVKAHTLRAWEKRYGLPQPERNAIGHRLYSAHDIDVVRWLLARQEEGLTIGHAVELWFNLKNKGGDPLAMVAQRPDELPATAGNGQDQLTKLRQQWIDACMRFHEPAAERVLTQAFAMFPINMVCMEILQRGLAQVGTLWHHNQATAHQEHFTTALTTQRLDTLLTATPPSTRIGRILAACPPYEEHAVPILLLTLLLRHQGWEVVNLRANMPLMQFDATLNAIKPDLIILAAQRLYTAATLLDAAHLAGAKGIDVAFGGMVFNLIPDLRQRIPGHFLGETIEAAIPAVTKIMTFNPTPAAAQKAADWCDQALALYQSKRALMELETGQVLDAYGIPYKYLEDTHRRLSDSIVAALRLGDLAYLDAEIALERELITNYGISTDWQIRYFEAYFLAAHKHLQGAGMPIINWLDAARADISGA